MDSLRKGLFAGLTAGLVLALLYSVDYGPGTNLHTVAKWFGLDSKDAGGYIGFVLLLILGALFGLAFGAFQREREVTLKSAIIAGLILGVAWFVILVLLLGTTVGHVTLGPYGVMLFIVTSLLYGLLVGMLYYQNPLSRTSK
jgi:uncharacterized membrane protein YkvI